MSQEGSSSGEVKMVGVGEDQVAVYATNVNVSFRPEEVFLEFGQAGNGSVPGQVTRLGTYCISPGHAKRLLLALQRSLERHERLFGEVVSDPAARLTIEGKHMLGLSNAGDSNESDAS